MPHFFALTSYIAAIPETFVRRKVTKKGEIQENHAPLTPRASKSVRKWLQLAQTSVPAAAQLELTHFGELGAVSDCMAMSKTDDQIRISPK